MGLRVCRALEKVVCYEFQGLEFRVPDFAAEEYASFPIKGQPRPKPNPINPIPPNAWSPSCWQRYALQKDSENQQCPRRGSIYCLKPDKFSSLEFRTLGCKLWGLELEGLGFDVRDFRQLVG